MSIRTYLAPLVLVFAATACSAPQAGIPAGTPAFPAPPSSQTSVPPTAAPSTGLAAIDVCDLLTAQEASSLGVPPQGRADEILGLRSCDWTSLGGGGFSTTINEKLGIDGLVLTDASSITDVTIGRYQAKRALETSGPGFCGVYFAVGETANVSVVALYLNDTPKACAVADRAAALIEPKLP